MNFTVTDKMRADIKAAVEELERVTNSEMVCVLAPASARYIMFPLLWSALFALLIPIINPFMPIDPETGDAVFEITFAWQPLIFVFLAGILLFSPLSLAVTPKGVRFNNCHRYAFEQFFVYNMNETEKHTGVMLFVSVDERYVELLADKGINDKVEPGEWDKIVEDFIADVRANNVSEGFVKAVQACQAVLSKHFPEEKEQNELSDNLVELPHAPFLS